MEPDGIFGNPFSDLLKSEGSYLFRAAATYGDLQCTGSSPARFSGGCTFMWASIRATPDWQFSPGSPGPGGQVTGTITITPGRCVRQQHLARAAAMALPLPACPAPPSPDRSPTTAMVLTPFPSPGIRGATRIPASSSANPAGLRWSSSPRRARAAIMVGCGCLLGLLLALLGFIFLKETGKHHHHHRHHRHHRHHW